MEIALSLLLRAGGPFTVTDAHRKVERQDEVYLLFLHPVQRHKDPYVVHRCLVELLDALLATEDNDRGCPVPVLAIVGDRAHIFHRGRQRVVIVGDCVEVEPKKKKKEGTKSQRKGGIGSRQKPQANVSDFAASEESLGGTLLSISIIILSLEFGER